MNWFIKNEISAKRMKQAAGTAAKSRRDTHSSSAFSLSPAVPFSLTPTEMWIDGHPPGNSVICCPPPFAPLGEKKKREKWDQRNQTIKTNMEKILLEVSAGQLTEYVSEWHNFAHDGEHFPQCVHSQTVGFPICSLPYTPCPPSSLPRCPALTLCTLQGISLIVIEVKVWNSRDIDLQSYCLLEVYTQ